MNFKKLKVLLTVACCVVASLENIQCMEERNYEYPKEFYCPITYEIMNDPVVAEDGFSYERTASW